MEFAGASAVVTGGASGIGKATVEALSSAGCPCVIVDLDEANGTELASQLGAQFVRADVTNSDEVTKACEAAVATAPLRIVVNAAGIGDGRRTVDRNGVPFDFAVFERVIRINLLGTFNVVRLGAAAMSRNDPAGPDGTRGVIVALASIAAFDGQIGQAAYSASKAGIVGLTLPVARDLASFGIRMNTIAPGLIDTPIYGEGPKAEEMKSHLAAGVLFPRRLGTADEVAGLIMQVVDNDYLNGEVIRLDGGLRMPPR